MLSPAMSAAHSRWMQMRSPVSFFIRELIFATAVLLRRLRAWLDLVTSTGRETSHVSLAWESCPKPAEPEGARRLMLTLLEEAKARGEEAMVLEVIEQNPPAHTLYRGHGFREVTRLCGWRRRVEGGSVGKPLPESRQTLEEISLTRASQLPNALEYPELPWQISRHAVAKLAIGRAFRTENAVVVIGDPETTPIRVHALFSTISDRMDWTAVRQAILALLNRYPDREFFTPAVFPEKFSEEVFEPLGFIREPLSQFLMRHDLQIQTT